MADRSPAAHAFASSVHWLVSLVITGPDMSELEPTNSPNEGTKSLRGLAVQVPYIGPRSRLLN